MKTRPTARSQPHCPPEFLTTSRLLAIAVVLLAGCASHTPGPATASTAQPWPKAIAGHSQPRAEQIPTSSLPAALRETLLSNDDFTQGTESLPEALSVRRIDLNNDGSPEYIVNSRASGTGGTTCYLYERSGRGYREIGHIQSGFHLLERHHGYYQIECWSRAGGGKQTRTLERFERGRYHLVRIEDYTDDDEPRFLGSRDAKEYDRG